MSKKIYINGSYLSVAEQKQIFGVDYKIYNSFHIGERKPKKGFLYWGKYLIGNYYINLFSKNRRNCDIQIFNSIIGCFFYSSNKKNIIIIHSYDIGINSGYVKEHSSSYIKKYIITFLEILFGRYIRNNIQKFDTVFTTTYDRFEYIKKNIYNDVIFLPNIINLPKNIGYKSPGNKKIFFCPERVDNNKGLELRKEIILLISKLHPNDKILLLERGGEVENFKKWIKKRNLKVEWIQYMSETELCKCIYQSFMIIGIFENGALSITNMQAMLLKTGIITYDKWESIKIEKNEIMTYAKNILKNKKIRESEIEKNYQYIYQHHSLKNHRKILMDSL